MNVNINIGSLNFIVGQKILPRGQWSYDGEEFFSIYWIKEKINSHFANLHSLLKKNTQAAVPTYFLAKIY